MHQETANLERVVYIKGEKIKLLKGKLDDAKLVTSQKEDMKQLLNKRLSDFEKKLKDSENQLLDVKVTLEKTNVKLKLTEEKLKW